MKLLPLLFLLTLGAGAQTHRLLVGSYTDGKSEGIYVYNFNSSNGDFEKISSAKCSNPSYLCVSPNKKNVYAVYEDGNNNNIGGSVAAYSFDKNSGVLSLINKQPSGGDHPCYVAVDKTGKWVTAGNYNGGNVAVLPVNNNGGIGTAIITQHTGSSTNKQRQEKAHVHCTYFSYDNRFLFVPDLGMDKVMIYNFDENTGALTTGRQPFVQADTGAGPRHIDFSPNNKYAYVMQELTGMVAAYKYKKGTLSLIQNISAAPKGFTGFMGSADIHVSPDGKFLYCSNRGESNSISIFSIDKKSGMLALISNSPSLGIAPRNFNFDPSGNFLLVANQKSDNIIIFKRDKKTGLLTDTGKKIETGSPVCLKWIL